MPVLECKHCGAPLPEAAASGPVTCPYCKTVNESTAAIQRPKSLSAEQQKEAFKEAIKEEIEEHLLKGRPAAPIPSAPPVRRGKSLGQSIRGCLNGCGCLVILLGGALVYGFLKDPGAVARGFKQIVGGGLKPQDLREITSHDAVRLDVPPPTGGFSSYDPGRNMDWLMTQVKGWAPDARLRRLRVLRIGANGNVDLRGDPLASLEAEFDSPAALAKSLSAHAHAYRELNTGLLLRIAKGQVAAKLEWGGPRQPTRPDLSSASPLKDVFTSLKAARRLPDEPLYNGVLTCDVKNGWTWSFHGLTSSEPIPKVRAAGGAIIR